MHDSNTVTFLRSNANTHTRNLNTSASFKYSTTIAIDSAAPAAYESWFSHVLAGTGLGLTCAWTLFCSIPAPGTCESWFSHVLACTELGLICVCTLSYSMACTFWPVWGCGGYCTAPGRWVPCHYVTTVSRMYLWDDPSTRQWRSRSRYNMFTFLTF